MATKTPEPTSESTEQPSEAPLPMPTDGGTYIRNEDGSLTKVEDHAQS